MTVKLDVCVYGCVYSVLSTEHVSGVWEVEGELGEVCADGKFGVGVF